MRKLIFCNKFLKQTCLIAAGLSQGKRLNTHLPEWAWQLSVTPFYTDSELTRPYSQVKFIS